MNTGSNQTFWSAAALISGGSARRTRALAIIWFVIAFVVAFFHASEANAATYYVNAGNPAPEPPYTNWLTAATNIQDAIGMTVNGDTVLVTNGVYAYGGSVTAMAGTLTNRIAVTNAITVESVNGPWVTSILGSRSPNVRCAALTNGASLIGFTVADGFDGGYGGGAVWCASSNALIQACIIVSNTAAEYADGVYRGTVNSCFVSENGRGMLEGATYQAVVNNCTIVNNDDIGVSSPLAMTNCIVCFNYINYEVSGNAFSHCCTTPALAGTGNFTNAPTLYVDGIHLANNSPCIGAGVYIGGGTDIFGSPYANPPSVGCAEWQPTPLVAAPQLTLTSSPIGFSIGNFAFAAAAPFGFSWLQNGQPLADNGHFSGTQTSNLIATGVSIADAGNYQVVVSNSYGSATSAVVTLTIHCVNGSGLDPTAPYTSWATAATNIQDAISASAAGDVVLVTNGIYNSGGKSMDGVITNRVSIDKAILLTSVNGAATTVIQGAWDPTSRTGPGAVRCVWMTNDTILNGFSICGGATRVLNTFAGEGGGILVFGTNTTIYNCLLSTNVASYFGGGLYGENSIFGTTTVIGCTFVGNQTYVAYGSAGNGGGAERCTLQNCLFLNNSASQASGGGADSCNLRNCALIGNSAYSYGTAANGGTLINCTVISNSLLNGASEGPAVYSATLTNCIVINNSSGPNSSTNYANCTLAYCCADPLPPGPGNIDVNPQLLGDGIHLAQTSPCIGAGTSIGISGTDIDGQPWNNPPSIGCDEWYPKPIISFPPVFQVGSPPHDLTWNVIVAGQAPFEYFWTQNGVPIQDDGHHNNSGTANMVINNFGPSDAGLYQVVVTNSSGSVTSAPVQVVIHAVNACGANPVPPYSSWADAATNIQDAINVATPGDIVLVTNGIYSHGGVAVSGSLTNRVALNLPITVISVNGFKTTVIQGAWDPISTNGPGAVRCAFLADGAVLNGFTLENGATFATGDSFEYGPLESGGGILCNSTNGIVLDCELTNNSAVYGGGVADGTVDNSLIFGNMASYGGGALLSTLNNCTVLNNEVFWMYGGGGTYSAIVKNSIVLWNDDIPLETDNGDNSSGLSDVYYAYSCSLDWPSPLPPNAGDIESDPVFIGLYHLSTQSQCYGAGSAAFSTGYDLDGQPWNNPPSMGCSEIVLSNLVGPLSVNCTDLFTNVPVGHDDGFYGTIQGHAAYLSWSFGDGTVYSNLDSSCGHQWTNSGTYSVILTAYNNDNPNGVSTNLVVWVQPLAAAQIQSVISLTNGFGFQFPGQMNAIYTIQYATNLTPPVSWQTLQTIYYNTQPVIQILDPSGTNAARFYRVLTQ